MLGCSDVCVCVWLTHTFIHCVRYMTAVVVKDKMEEWLDPVDEDTPHSQVRVCVDVKEDSVIMSCLYPLRAAVPLHTHAHAPNRLTGPTRHNQTPNSPNRSSVAPR